MQSITRVLYALMNLREGRRENSRLRGLWLPGDGSGAVAVQSLL